MRLLNPTLVPVAAVALAVSLWGAEGTKRPAVNPPAKAPSATVANAPARRPAGLKPGEELFATNAVLRIRLEMSRTALDELRRDPRQYARATVIEGGAVYKDVAVHLKGAAGSMRGVDDKPAFTLSFGKFTPGQDFHGLRKIHLNNSVQDPSYTTELICGEMFVAAGVPSPRVAHALVELNDRKLGLYVLKEGFTREFLSLHFKKTSGNLYDGGFLRDITDPLEKDSGSGPDDRSDLKALVAAAQERDPDKRWERLKTVLDVPRFISFMVVENMTWDWDGYVMNRNNYRIYHDDDTGKLVFLPHGLDQMFWEANGPIAGNVNGLLAQSILRTAEGRRLYRQRYSALFTNVYDVPRLTNRLAELEARIKPALAAHNPQAARDFVNHVRDVRQKIIARAEGIRRQLEQPPPAALPFKDGVAVIPRWRQHDEEDTAQLDQVREGNRNLMTIKTVKPTTASWRARITLLQGRYRFEGLAKAAGIQPTRDEKGAGAGLRISGAELPRANQLTGSSDWKKLEFPIEVAAPFEELELVCELRATAGQVWFDVDSLRLVRVK